MGCYAKAQWPQLQLFPLPQWPMAGCPNTPNASHKSPAGTPFYFWGGGVEGDLTSLVSPTSSQVQKAEARIKLQELPGQPRPHKDGVATQFNYSDLLWGVGPESSYLNGMGAYFPFLLLC